MSLLDKPKSNELLQSIINKQTKLSALLRLVPKLNVSVSQLKTLLCQHVDCMAESEARLAVCNVRPIAEILPSDLLQMVACFDHGRRLKLISKSWGQFYIANQELIRKARSEVVLKHSDQYCVPQASIETAQKIWAVRNRPMHYMWTQQLQQKHGNTVRIKRNLRECVRDAQTGDIILLRSGTYNLATGDVDVPITGKMVRIVGLDEDVCVQCQFGVVHLSERAQLHLHNLSLDCTWNGCAFGVQVGPDCTLWAKDCKLTHKRSVIMMERDSRVHLLSCTLTGDTGLDGCHDSRETSAVWAVGCTFHSSGWAVYRVSKLGCFGCKFKKGMIYCTPDSEVKLVGNVFDEWQGGEILNECESRNVIEL